MKFEVVMRQGPGRVITEFRIDERWRESMTIQREVERYRLAHGPR